MAQVRRCDTDAQITALVTNPATELVLIEDNEPNDIKPSTTNPTPWKCASLGGVDFVDFTGWLLQRGQHVHDLIKSVNPLMPVGGPAFTNYLAMCKYPDETAQGADATCFGIGDALAAMIDFRVVHDYPTWYPLATQYGNNAHVKCPAGAQATCYLKFEDLAGNTGMISGEYGWTDQIGTANYTPDAVIAKYLLRAFELKQNEGYSHLYDFQLCPGSTGFAGARLRSTCSVGVADPVLPQFTAFQSYVAHFRDSGTPALTPIGYNLTSTVSTVQFGKLSQFSDGRYSVVAWNEVASSAHGTGALISVPLAPTKLVLPPQYTPNGATATTQNADGSFSTNPVSFALNVDGSSELDYGVPDSLVILEFYVGPHATPSPLPTSSPSPAPTSAPVPSGVATYLGCAMGAPNDIWNHVVTGDAIDSNSAALIAGTDSVERETFYASVPLYMINTGTNATPVIPAVPGGRGPTSVPFINGTSYFEGQPQGHQGDGGDSHYIFLNTQTCTYTELYSASYVNGTMDFYDGNTEPTNKPNTGRVLGMTLPNWYTTAGGLDIFPGIVKWEELQAGRVPHALIMSLNVGNISSTKNIFPGGPQVGSTYRGTGTPLMYDSHLRLKPNYTDASATKDCNTLLTAMKQHGLYVNDQSSNGVQHAVYVADAWNDPGGKLYPSGDFACLNNVHLTDFDVLTPVVRP